MRIRIHRGCGELREVEVFFQHFENPLPYMYVGHPAAMKYKARHLTYCYLMETAHTRSDRSVHIAVGEAFCSRYDTPRVEIGERHALSRALEIAGAWREDRLAAFEEYERLLAATVQAQEARGSDPAQQAGGRWKSLKGWIRSVAPNITSEQNKALKEALSETKSFSESLAETLR